jgi:hypothetical protein
VGDGAGLPHDLVLTWLQGFVSALNCTFGLDAVGYRQNIQKVLMLCNLINYSCSKRMSTLIQ